jgi:hypothetical protein
MERVHLYDGQGFWLAAETALDRSFRVVARGSGSHSKVDAHQAQMLLAAGNPAVKRRRCGAESVEKRLAFCENSGMLRLCRRSGDPAVWLSVASRSHF